jgi:uncharacterized protein
LSTALRILLPLSEKKKAGGREGAAMATAKAASLWKFRTLGASRKKALEAFRAAMANNASALKVLGMKAGAFKEAYVINRALDRSRLTNVLERSNGTFAATLRPKDLPERLRRKLDEKLLFVCPLLGVLSPKDRVPDYRCPEGAKLPGVGSLHKHWKPEVTKFLNRVLRRRHVLNLLPTRLAALWEPDGGAASIVSVRFGRFVGVKIRGETAATPKLTGEALRFAIENGVEDPIGLTKFKSSLGHSFSAAHSVVDGPVRVMWFVR